MPRSPVSRLTAGLLVILVMAASGTVLASPEGEPVGSGSRVGQAIWQLVQFIFLFGLVVALAYLTTRLLGRRLAGAGTGRYLRLLDQTPLGSGRAICLVRAGGRYLLLGVSEKSIGLLAELDPGEVPPAEEVPPARPISPTTWLRERWEKLVRRQGPEGPRFSDQLKKEIDRLEKMVDSDAVE
ncbi:MAG: flagellar biosynthetic protein FliO [Bacillota bacterium]